MDNNLTLSICIPTDGNLLWVSQVLDAIYKQDCDIHKFEVVIADNGIGNDLEKYVKAHNFSNLVYSRTNTRGFLNIIESLKLGNGKFCKVLNHRAILLPGALLDLVKIIDKYQAAKPVIYCSNGYIEGKSIIDCPNFNNFVQIMSYWSSWMGGLGIWNDDKYILESISYDRLFPNTSLLFEMRQQSEYIIINKPILRELESDGKGGYNVFEAFSVCYLDILNSLRKRERISIETFINIKRNLFKWLVDLYSEEVILKSKHSFDLHYIRRYMQVYFTYYDYVLLVFKAYVRIMLNVVKRSLKFKLS